jgi:delta 1-pyrroline-5-carboxylate dehydrogenase
MVVKPAESTPYSALALAVLAERAGIPAGVFNVVTGDPKEIGAEMTSNPDVRKVTFTGSTAIGRLLMQQSAGTVKKLSLELNLAGTRRLSFSTMPIWMRQWKGRSLPNIETRARLAFV